PDRINVNLNVNKEDFSCDDTVTALVNAMNLFGPPATDRKYEIEYSLSYKYFSPKDFKGYNFSINHGKNVEFTKDLREGQTDGSGNARENFKVNAAYRNIGVLEGKIFATVFDETGRPVNRLTRFDVFTQDVFYGIKMSDYYIPTGDNYSIPLIAVDK